MASRNADRSYSKKKMMYQAKMNDYLDTYDKILVVGCDNVTSRQFNHMRIEMRSETGKYGFKGNILMGKNTMMKKVLKMRAERENATDINRMQYEKFNELLKLNVGLIFTNGDLQNVKEMVVTNKKQAAAKVGATAPCDVVVPAGNTGLEPGQTTFFQALNIPTKITKGTIEILKEIKIINEGDRVGSSAAMLLKKMKVEPFTYGLKMLNVYDSGSFYSPKVLDMTQEDKEQMIQGGIKRGADRIAALSLAIGYPTLASFPHSVFNEAKKVTKIALATGHTTQQSVEIVAQQALKNLMSISLGTNYLFSAFGAADIVSAVKSGKSLGGPAAPAASGGGGGAKAGAPAPAAKAPEPESEEDEDFGGLFD